MSDEVKQVSLAAATPNPAALGLAGFGVTTFILSMFNAGFLPAAATLVVLGPAAFYGGLAQLLAGQQEYKTGNVFGATAFSTYGAFWLSFAFFQLMAAIGVFKFGGAAGAAAGIFLIGFTIFNTYMWIASFKVSVAVCTIFTTLEITFILLDVGAFGHSTIFAWGGYFGIICALSALYTSAAIVLNTVYKKVVLPIGPLD
jgi:succinate-acetate transporter protein